MAKIPFDIKYRPQIESGEYKVIDRFGYVLTLRDIINDAWYFSLRYPNTDYETERIYDHPENHLFLVTPEEELTEFEKGCIRLYQDGRDDGFAGDNLSDEALKESAAELLDLARKEILKDEKVLTVSGPGFYAGGETRFTNIPIADALKAEYEKGKAEALKDLPRWGLSTGRFDEGWLNAGFLYYKFHAIPLKTLEKLPGFKEDSHD